MIIIYSGEIRSGKTTSLMQWTQDRSDIGGFLTPDKNGMRYLFHISSKSWHPFEVRERSNETTVMVGRFSFLKSSFDLASEFTSKQMHSEIFKYIIIDEVGKLEVGLEGFHDLVKEIINSTKCHIILVVRKPLVQKVVKVFKIKTFHLIHDIVGLENLIT